MGLVLDTGPLLAALDAADPDHEACSTIGCHERLSAQVWLAFLEDLLEGAYRAEPPGQRDFERSHEPQKQYADLRLGVVDASVVALAERFNEPKIGTLDHRHFTVVRPAHVGAFELWPSGSRD